MPEPPCGPLLGGSRLARLAGSERRPALDHGQHLLGEEPQTGLRDGVGRAAEAKGHIHFEVAKELSALLEPAQDLVRCAPACGLHEASDRTLEPCLAGDFGLLLIGVIALYRLEVVAQKLIVMEIALDELALVRACFLLG